MKQQIHGVVSAIQSRFNSCAIPSPRGHHNGLPLLDKTVESDRIKTRAGKLGALFEKGLTESICHVMSSFISAQSITLYRKRHSTRPSRFSVLALRMLRHKISLGSFQGPDRTAIRRASVAFDKITDSDRVDDLAILCNRHTSETTI